MNVKRGGVIYFYIVILQGEIIQVNNSLKEIYKV